MQDLNDLRFFAAVVSSGGFSAAARELGVPKSRLSRRVHCWKMSLACACSSRVQVARLGLGALARRLAAIVDQHRRCGLQAQARDPAVRAVLREGRRTERRDVGQRVPRS